MANQKTNGIYADLSEQSTTECCPFCGSKKFVRCNGVWRCYMCDAEYQPSTPNSLENLEIQVDDKPVMKEPIKEKIVEQKEQQKDSKQSFDLQKYADSFFANVSLSKDYKVSSLKKQYVGYGDKILVVPKKLQDHLKEHFKYNFSLPAAITREFNKIIFEDGCNAIRITISKNINAIIYPDSFTSIDLAIEDGSGVREIVFPTTLESARANSTSNESLTGIIDCFKNIEKVKLPQCISRQLSIPIMTKESKMYKKYVNNDGHFIIGDCLLDFDSKDKIFFIPNNIKKFVPKKLNDEIETIIASPNTEIIDLPSRNYFLSLSRPLDVYCPNSIIAFRESNSSSRLFYDGTAMKLLTKIERPLKEIITNDLYCLGSRSVKPYPEHTRQLNEYKNLYFQHYSIDPKAETKKATKTSISLHLQCIPRIGKVDYSGVEELWIDCWENNSNDKQEFWFKRSSLPNLKIIHIDSGVKSLSFEFEFDQYIALFKNVEIQYDSTKENFEKIFDAGLSNGCLKIHCSDGVYTYKNQRSFINKNTPKPPELFSIKNNIVPKSRQLLLFDPRESYFDEEYIDEYRRHDFLDFQNFLVRKYNQNTSIEDSVEHDLISPYYYEKYTVIKDFAVEDDWEPLKFNEKATKQILNDYRLLEEFNDIESQFTDEQIIALLSNLSHEHLIPAVTNEDSLTPPVVCFWTVENIKEIPLLLLISIYKTVFGFKKLELAAEPFATNAVLWNKNKNNDCVTFYAFTDAIHAQKFSGYLIKDFDSEKISLQKGESNLPSLQDVFETSYIKIRII